MLSAGTLKKMEGRKKERERKKIEESRDVMSSCNLSLSLHPASSSPFSLSLSPLKRFIFNEKCDKQNWMDRCTCWVVTSCSCVEAAQEKNYYLFPIMFLWNPPLPFVLWHLNRTKLAGTCCIKWSKPFAYHDKEPMKLASWCSQLLWKYIIAYKASFAHPDPATSTHW